MKPRLHEGLMHKTVKTPLLEVAYEEAGEGTPVILLHGFPYDVRVYDAVVPLVPEARVIVPWLRGYGPTRFLRAETMRSGQQAALAQDLIDLMDALKIDRAVLAGFDWGGRAACVVSALFPERVLGLLTCNGYNVHDVPHSVNPLPPEREKPSWYVYYLQSERGRRGLEAHRASFCELLWRDWSPRWAAAGEAFRASAPALMNPDFVDVVVHSYRVRHGLVAGDPRYDELEARLTRQPKVTVPTIALNALDDGLGVDPSDASMFTGPYREIDLPGVGHNPPAETPQIFADALLSLSRRGEGRGEGK